MRMCHFAGVVISFASFGASQAGDDTASPAPRGVPSVRFTGKPDRAVLQFQGKPTSDRVLGMRLKASGERSVETGLEFEGRRLPAVRSEFADNLIVPLPVGTQVVYGPVNWGGQATYFQVLVDSVDEPEVRLRVAVTSKVAKAQVIRDEEQVRRNEYPPYLELQGGCLTLRLGETCSRSFTDSPMHIDTRMEITIYRSVGEATKHQEAKKEADRR